jgi:glycosyltransferase involved in cell wall biosynthesis
MFEHSGVGPHCCSYIRLILPLTHPAIEREIAATVGADYRAAEVLIIDRLLAPDTTLPQVEEIVQRTRADGACLIYHLDDDLLDLLDPSPFRKPISVQQRMMIRYLARESDGLIVSTANLRRRMARFSGNIEVVRNAIDERLFDFQTSKAIASPDQSKSLKTIGYMGTLTHERDIMMIALALRAVLRKHADQVALEFVGGFSDPSVMASFQGLPVRVLDATTHSEYPAFVRWMSENLKWDLAIAPLVDTPFTRCKSDIKFLDYGALGIPGIYSDVAPYRGVIKHLNTGYLAPNSFAAWSEALEVLLKDDLLRSQIAANARHYVQSKRTLSCCAVQWRDAIQALMRHRSRAASGQ